MTTSSSFTITLQTECDRIASQTPTQRVVELRVCAPPALVSIARAPLNLALVIDRSGSMSGHKLDFVKQAARHIVSLLTPADRVALVSFDDQVTVDAPGTHMDSAGRDRLNQAIDRLEAGNTTNLSGGWMQGCHLVAEHQTDGSLNRVLLLTDGLANRGITDEEELGTHARELATRGVATSTFGVGMGFNEHLLETMANLGSGNFYFIAEPADIPGIFAREFTEIAGVTARGVEVVIDLPAHVHVEVMGGWRHEMAGSRLHLFPGDLTNAREQEIYLKLLLPQSTGDAVLELHAHATAQSQQNTPLSAVTALTFTYADSEVVAAAGRDAGLLQRAARVAMSDETNRALRLERQGRREEAQVAMQRALQENLPNLPPEDVERLEGISYCMHRGMQEDDRKSVQYDAYKARRRREDSGNH